MASWLTTPLDLIKLRLQVQSATGEAPLSSAAAQAASAAGTADTMGRAATGASKSAAEGLGHVAVEQKLYRGMLDGLTKVIRGDGVVGLWKGALPRVLYHTPASAITIKVFESVRQWLQ